MQRNLRATNKLTTSSGFRLIRAFTTDHNAARARKHFDRLGRSVRAEPVMRRLRIKRRRQERAVK